MGLTVAALVLLCDSTDDTVGSFAFWGFLAFDGEGLIFGRVPFRALTKNV
jgi:hypothetical protein